MHSPASAYRGGCCVTVSGRAGLDAWLLRSAWSGCVALGGAQAAWRALWSLIRLWVAAMSRHSERQAALPRLAKRVKPLEFGVREHRLDELLASSIELFAALALEHSAQNA